MEISHDESWREETGLYLARLISASQMTDEWCADYKKYWPGCFWSTAQPTTGASIAIRLCVYASSVFSSALVVSREIENQWKSGVFVLVPIGVRFLVESWGAIHFARITLERLLRENNIEREEERVNRLTHGSRINKNSMVRMPFGGETNKQSFNVMDFIDSLADVGNEPAEGYKFLCEASHPNFVQSTYFRLAGPPLANWANDAYKQHSHQLLNKTVEIMELAMAGIKSDFLHMLEVGTSYVESERDDNEA